MSSKSPARPSDSLRLQLLRWLLLPLLLLLSVNAWFSNRAAVANAAGAFDRLLTASAQAIAEDIEVKDGKIVVDLPYAALELLETNLQERIFYRVVAPDGKTLTGYDDLPLPPQSVPAPKLPRREQAGLSAQPADSNPSPAVGPTLYAARYRGETIHLALLQKRLYRAGPSAPVSIIVAETGEARDALSHQILVDGLQRQGLLIVAAGGLVWIGMLRGLRPLGRLRRQVAQRAPSDLSPIDPAGVQREVRPLIDALNLHTARIERLLSSRQRLITDASHQMRTPLAEMRTQIEYSLRQNQPELSHQTLLDVHGDIDRLARLLSQLLLQARADPDGLPDPRSGRADLVELARAASLDLVGAARRKTIDLSFEAPAPAVTVAGNGLLLRELINNLIENAITHGRVGGQVRVRVAWLPGYAGRAQLEVEDDGPGILPVDRERVFERFYRAANGSAPGSGLGLAIVRDIARAHAASVELLTPTTGAGLCVRVAFAPAPAPAEASSLPDAATAPGPAT